MEIPDFEVITQRDDFFDMSSMERDIELKDIPKHLKVKVSEVKLQTHVSFGGTTSRRNDHKLGNLRLNRGHR